MCVRIQIRFHRWNPYDNIFQTRYVWVYFDEILSMPTLMLYSATLVLHGAIFLNCFLELDDPTSYDVAT